MNSVFNIDKNLKCIPIIIHSLLNISNRESDVTCCIINIYYDHFFFFNKLRFYSNDSFLIDHWYN